MVNPDVDVYTKTRNHSGVTRGLSQGGNLAERAPLANIQKQT